MKLSRVETNNIWMPDLTFIGGGTSYFFDPYTQQNEKISWKLSELAIRGLPMTFSRCDMNGFDHSVSGMGEGLFLKMSAVKAFAEAWERLWMMRVGTENVLPDFKIRSSNGFASGVSLEDARNRAKAELIERAAMLEAWAKQKGWRPIKTEGFLVKILNYCFFSAGWSSNYYQIAIDNGGFVLCGLLRNKEKGALFDCCYFNNRRHRRDSFIKLIRSLAKSIALNRVIKTNKNWSLPEFGSPEDHSIYYSNPKNLDAFIFLDEASDDKYNDIKIRLPNLDKIALFNVIGVSSFPAVAVSFNESWPELTWGKQSITRANPWPHPLA